MLQRGRRNAVCGWRGLRGGRWVGLWVILCCGWGVAWGLDPRTPLDGFAKQVWSTDNGLPQSSVHAIAQTTDGFLWFGTEGGLARFDGYQFKVFDQQSTPGMSGDDIRCLVADGSGALWVGTASGLTRVKDGRARSFGVSDGLAAGAVRAAVISSDGRLWVLTTGGLAVGSVSGVEAAKIRFKSFRQGDGVDGGVVALAADERGGMWVGTTRGLSHVVGEQVEAGPGMTLGVGVEAVATARGDASVLVVASGAGLMRVKDGVATMLAKREAMPAGGVRSLLVLNDGVWAAGRDSVSVVRSGETVKFVAGVGLPGTQVITMTGDAQGGVWIGTNGGVARFVGGRMETMADAREKDGVAALAIFEDREGEMWLGTETAGVEVLRKRTFELLQTSTGLEDDAATSVMQGSDGAVWAGTNGGGVTRFGGKEAGPRTFTTKDGLASDTVLTLADGGSADGVWVGTPDGLSEMRDGRWRTFTSADGLADDLVRSVLVTRDGAAWVGTRHGVTRWKDGRGTSYTTAQGLGSDLVGPMLEDAGGDLWIGTSGGLSRLHAGTVRNFTVADGLPSHTIAALEAGTGGTVWVGTEGQGLAEWDGTRFFSFAGAAGLPHEIYGLLEDGRGCLWISSGHGIFRVDVEALNRFRSGKKGEVEVTGFGSSDGLPPVEAVGAGYPSAARLGDGRLAFASRRGVVLIDPASMTKSDVAPPVVVEGVTVDDVGMTPEAMASLAPGPSHFAFSFAGIHFAAPQRVQYRYRMEGLDAGWIDAGTRRTAYYTNLPHGHYTFLVCARIAGGPWSEPAAIAFALRPRVYQTIWFRALMVVLLVVLGLGLYGLRVRTLQRGFDAVAAERSRLAREIHDTLAQSFVAVSVRLEIMSQMLRKTEGVSGAREQLDQTRTLVRESLEEARRSIWDLRTEGTEAQALPARLARLVRETTQRGAHTQMETTGVYRGLAQRVEDEVYRIAQESVTNAVRHAEAQAIELRLSYEIDRLLLEVRDNGRGFDVSSAPAGEKGHFGLTGLRERARALDAEIMLESNPGVGTSVRLMVPIARESKEKRKDR